MQTPGRKTETRSVIDFGPAGALLFLVAGLQLLHQLLERHRRAAEPFLLAFVKLLEADRQRPCNDVDAVPHALEIGRILLIALLITRFVEMHEDALVWQVGFEHAAAGVHDTERHRVLVMLEDDDVLELVSVFSADVNLAPGKLVDHLVAAEKRHRIARREIQESWCGACAARRARR